MFLKNLNNKHMYKLSFIALVLATAFFDYSDEKTTEKEV